VQGTDDEWTGASGGPGLGRSLRGSCSGFNWMGLGGRIDDFGWIVSFVKRHHDVRGVRDASGMTTGPDLSHFRQLM
jgi:hypothetical protein